MMRVGELHDTPCDPNHFYKNTIPQLNPTFVSFITMLAIIMQAISIAFSPLMIFSPYLIPNLRTALRKIIAMISLADVIVSVTGLIQIYETGSWYEEQNSTNHAPWQCDVITAAGNGAIVCSVMWSFLLLVYVWITLHPHLGWLNKRWLPIVGQTVGWGVGILLQIFPFLLTQVEVSNNYLFSAGCQFRIDFVIQYWDREQLCLPDRSSRLWLLLDVYVPIGVITLLTTLAFFVDLISAYKLRTSIKQRSRAINDESGSGGGGRSISLKDVRESRELLRTVLKLSFTGAIYTLAIVPVLIKQFVEMLHGPTTSLLVSYGFLCVFTLSTPFIGLANLLLYGLMSSVFRQQVANYVRRLLGLPYPPMEVEESVGYLDTRAMSHSYSSDMSSYSMTLYDSAVSP